nr:hypothetical protein [uncultured Pseudomonas sp.]
MNAFPRFCLLLLLALVLPLQSLAGVLLVAEPCSMSQGEGVSMHSDCCNQADQAKPAPVCQDMSKCLGVGLPLTEGYRLKFTVQPAGADVPLYSQAEPLSRPSLAPWRPPRA